MTTDSAEKKIALVINSNSELGLSVIRNACNDGFAVISLSSGNEPSLLDDLHFTNPEDRGLITYLNIKNDDLSNPTSIIENSPVLKNLKHIDLLISLNPTDDVFVKWDLDLLKKFYTLDLINKNSTVVITTSSDKTVFTTNKTLELYTENIQNVLSKHDIYVSNMVQLGAVKGDEEYIANSLTNEAFRTHFKVPKITSFCDLISLLVFYLMPGFLLKYTTEILKTLNTYTKEKND